MGSPVTRVRVCLIHTFTRAFFLWKEVRTIPGFPRYCLVNCSANNIFSFCQYAHYTQRLRGGCGFVDICADCYTEFDSRNTDKIYFALLFNPMQLNCIINWTNVMSFLFSGFSNICTCIFLEHLYSGNRLTVSSHTGVSIISGITGLERKNFAFSTPRG